MLLIETTLFLSFPRHGDHLQDFNTIYLKTLEQFKLPLRKLDENLVPSMRQGIDEILKKWKDLPIDHSLVLNFSQNSEI